MKKTNVNTITDRLIAIANKHHGNLADITLSSASYDLTDNVLCHLSSIDNGISEYGSLRYLHRLMSVLGLSNTEKNSPHAIYWIQPVQMEEDELAIVRGL